MLTERLKTPNEMTLAERTTHFQKTAQRISKARQTGIIQGSIRIESRIERIAQERFGSISQKSAREAFREHIRDKKGEYIQLTETQIPNSEIATRIHTDGRAHRPLRIYSAKGQSAYECPRCDGMILGLPEIKTDQEKISYWCKICGTNLGGKLNPEYPLKRRVSP